MIEFHGHRLARRHRDIVYLAGHVSATLDGRDLIRGKVGAGLTLEQAQEAANGLDVRIGGGVSTVRQFLANDLVDHMHLAVVPIVLGRGERLWDGLEGVHSRFDIQSVTMPSGVTHLTFTRR